MESKNRASASAFGFIGVFIAVLLCLSIVVDMMSFKRLSFLEVAESRHGIKMKEIMRNKEASE
ncbi:uncharacterized protein Eint_020355 [Encephalitozoon intestinalis ATCC 50506]|uniref:Uncharacterized protein n=1 Tax=Encephalitozoon intestinalis (strain ATCC 50506) TaxID=876142 RepID=W8PGL8_ENCIT|nr:uncharacterized protein Eint_020355 [Encephalitozoon intestinalis ATCC 50506]AHL30076.1 hypothetical protein Eint_020355 [Encephalitozoon intestinalis ATCC 50506]UTX44685.1 hypothetical protein GPK93_02g02000 [Encephalitozoon intestinalis]